MVHILLQIRTCSRCVIRSKKFVCTIPLSILTGRKITQFSCINSSMLLLQNQMIFLWKYPPLALTHIPNFQYFCCFLPSFTLQKSCCKLYLIALKFGTSTLVVMRLTFTSFWWLFMKMMLIRSHTHRITCYNKKLK